MTPRAFSVEPGFDFSGTSELNQKSNTGLSPLSNCTAFGGSIFRMDSPISLGGSLSLTRTERSAAFVPFAISARRAVPRISGNFCIRFMLKPAVNGHKKAQEPQKEKGGVETVVTHPVKVAFRATGEESTKLKTPKPTLQTPG